MGRIGLMNLLTEQGKVEAEFTAARLSHDHFYLVGAAVGEVRFFERLGSHMVESEDVWVNNVPDDLGGSCMCR